MSYNIPSQSWSTQSGANQLTIGNPLTIGTNLVLSQAGLSGPATFTFPNITDQVATLNSTGTLTNKIFSAASNSLQAIWQSVLYGRYGEAQPLGGAATGVGTLGYSGALGAHTYYSTNITFATAYDTSEGLVGTQVTTAVSAQGTGILSPTGATGICRTIFGGRLRTRFKVSTIASGNFYFGLTSNSTQPLTTTPIGAGESGIIIGWRTGTDTNFVAITNDTTGAALVTPITPNVPIDTAWHTLEINWPDGGTPVNCLVDGSSAVPITTRLPATTVPLFFNQVSATSTTTAITQSIHGTTVEFHK